MPVGREQEGGRNMRQGKEEWEGRERKGIERKIARRWRYTIVLSRV
jgi:hypothetical protein